jgi:hypothetical protein
MFWVPKMSPEIDPVLLMKMFLENSWHKNLPFVRREKREKISHRKISLLFGEKKGRKFPKEKSPFCSARKKGENFPQKNLPFVQREKGRKFLTDKSHNLPVAISWSRSAISQPEFLHHAHATNQHLSDLALR